MNIGIEFDDGNKLKLTKHGLSLRDIDRFFASQPVYTCDETHGTNEPRYIAFGNIETRFVFVAFTIRVSNGRLWIRPISARFARQKEIRKLYEKAYE